MSDTTNRDGRVGDADGVQPTTSAEDASTSVQDHDAHQPLVDDGDAPTQQMPVQDEAPRDDADDWQRSWDEAGGGDIEPTVIAPSALRGPSHEAEAEQSSLEQAPDEPVDHAHAMAPTDPAAADAVASSRSVEAGEHAEPTNPPELVEPRRPSLSLRGEQRPDLADTAPFEGLAGAGAVAGAGAAAGAAATSHREEPAATEAMPVQDDRTQAMPAAPATEPQFEVDEPVEEQRTERLGSIAVDDETARAAATGTPIVLVESATPPRKKGARGVGFLVVLLSTIVFAALLAAAFLAVDYLFDRGFVLQDALTELWLRPSWLLPVAVFLVAYWLTTIIVNRAGWWAHVLGGFIVALLAYGAHVAGAYLETQENVWDVTAIVGIGARDLGELLLAPTAIVTFLLAREVPIWFGGIVARRGRRAKQRNKEALEEYEAEQARRLEEYEATRA
ncbi:hypothetical protein [Agrococcus sp. SGAir0287]|uniref:hypothetical protein n=1 Tax=Agrococcus sp. SGAir0287 TaxID=2070347 RepID=UPI0010CCF054|nr:hypothetical protein [Agrococcus sp. SGAir0287]QCR20111.1 hypothetical protein C1N71_12215 [Agrococcus sp. SGAir0287]